MTVDHAKARAPEPCRRRYGGLRHEGVSHRVVLPGLEERRGDVTSRITTHQIDLAVIVTRSNERSHVRHVRSSGPHTRGDVVDARGSHYDTACGSVDSEAEELAHVRRLHH